MPPAPPASLTAPALDVAELASGYGDSLVIHDVSLAVGRGEIEAAVACAQRHCFGVSRNQDVRHRCQ